MAEAMSDALLIALITKSVRNPAIEHTNTIALNIATWNRMDTRRWWHLDYTLTFLEQSYRAYTRTCMMTSMAHRLIAPAIRVVGSIATHLQQGVRPIQAKRYDEDLHRI